MLQSKLGPEIDPRGLVPVAVKTLRNSAELAIDLYLWPPRSRRARLYRRKEMPLESLDVDQLLRQGVTTLYACSSEATQYCDYVRDRVLADERIPAHERYGLLREATRAVLTTALENSDVNAALSATADFSRDMVSVVCDHKLILSDLLAVMSHDYSTFTHVANVCTYSIVLARAFGIKSPDDLTQIAQGALLHDIGKRHIPARILNKTGPLNDREKDLIRQHPTHGFEELCLRPSLSWGQLMMVYQHHERYDGRGYPSALVGKETHEWGRLCAIADVYDAVTRDRAYRKGADIEEALEYIHRESGRSFDEELCECWVATLTQCLR